MSSKRIQRPEFTEPFHPLSLLAKQLHLPIKTLLYLSSEGYIPVFARVYPRDAMYVSVHKDFIAPHGADLPASVTSLANKSTLGISRIDGDNMLGFVLSPDDCRELINKGRLKQSLFPAAVRKTFLHLHTEFPRPGFFPVDLIPGIALSGWRAACYQKGTSFDLNTGNGYPPPTEFNITTAIYADQHDVDTFLDVINSPAFLDDLFETEGIRINVNDGEGRPDKKEDNIEETTTITHVTDEKAAYISKKLGHLIDTNQRCWRSKPSNLDDYARKRTLQNKALQDEEFHLCFNKGLVTENLLQAAAKFIEPLYARANAGYAGHEYLTPELLTLIATAKLYWSPSHVDLTKVATHPARGDIEAYLSFRGITGNDADYAITLIRPEGAAYGRPVPPSGIRRLALRPEHEGS